MRSRTPPGLPSRATRGRSPTARRFDVAAPCTCYAFGCSATVEPEHPMCPDHWALVPPHIQQLVRRQWRRGWADEPWPRYEWRAALDAAILAVARAEDG